MKGFEQTHPEPDADRGYAKRAAQIPKHLSDQCSKLVVVDVTHHCWISPEEVAQGRCLQEPTIPRSRRFCLAMGRAAASAEDRVHDYPCRTAYDSVDRPNIFDGIIRSIDRVKGCHSPAREVALHNLSRNAMNVATGTDSSFNSGC